MPNIIQVQENSEREWCVSPERDYYTHPLNQKSVWETAPIRVSNLCPATMISADLQTNMSNLCGNIHFLKQIC